MRSKMSVRTMALVLATITGMQASGIAPKLAGLDVNVYASDNIAGGTSSIGNVQESKQITVVRPTGPNPQAVEEGNKSNFNYSQAYKNAGIVVDTTTSGTVTINLPNAFTDTNNKSLDNLRGSDEATLKTAYIGVKFTTPQAVGVGKITKIRNVTDNNKVYALSNDSSSQSKSGSSLNDPIYNGDYIQYIGVATKGSDGKWNPNNISQGIYRYEWLNDSDKVVAKTSLNMVKQKKSSASVSISGTERVGKTLEAKVTATSYGKTVTPNSIKYQWQRSKHKDKDYDDISGETDDDYKLANRDEDKYIRVVVKVKVNVNGEELEVIDRTSTIDDKRKSSSSSSKGSGSTADSDRITDKLDDSNADNISYNVSDYPKVEKEVFEALKDNDDKTLILEGENCTWEFEGDDINNISAMGDKLDTTIETTSPNESEIKNSINNANVVNIYFKYDGVLPGKANIEVEIGSKYNGKNMYAYYYNSATKSLELVDSNVVIKDGNARFSITHCSDYILSETPLATTAGIQNGWRALSNGNWQLISAGIPTKGWNFSNGNWYYMDSFGMMQKGWMSSNGSWYYLNDSGDMATGWKQIGGNWYYLRGDGKMLTGWVNDRGIWYYMYSNGAMAYDTTINGYRLSRSGAMR